MNYQVSSFIESIIYKIALTLPELGKDFLPELRLSDPRFGDFQLNGALSHAKKTKQNPRTLAVLLAEKLKKKLPNEFAHIEVAGPGFINITLRSEYLLKWLKKFQSLADLKTAAKTRFAKETIVIDYSSPNTAKQMHVGHLRSLVIGEAIQRLLRFHGAAVIRDNHLGDWGTQFGILLMQIKEEGYDINAEHEDPLEDLEGLYKRGSARFKEDEKAQEIARSELVMLQKGNPESKALWEAVTTVSYKAFESLYQLFRVTFDQVQGESFYQDKLGRVYEELTQLGIAEESQGALVVFHPEHARFKETPFMIRKADGASNYGTTDLATALHHVEHAKATTLLYVVDGRQQDHFQQLFLTVEKWFKAKKYPLPRMEHISFGTVLGDDGKAIKTRSGDPIKLKDLAAEAHVRALKIVGEKSADLTEAEQIAIARIVGIGALRYADLCQNRSSDYVFSWDKMLTLEGNTAPYLLYATARIHSIFRKGGLKPGEGELGATAFETPQELALAHKIVLFAEALEATISDLRPHHLCLYLYELAGLFSSFYAADKVIAEDKGMRARRFMLCARTLLILETGLNLLGVGTVAKM